MRSCQWGGVSDWWRAGRFCRRRVANRVAVAKLGADLGLAKLVTERSLQSTVRR